MAAACCSSSFTRPFSVACSSSSPAGTTPIDPFFFFAFSRLFLRSIFWYRERDLEAEGRLAEALQTHSSRRRVPRERPLQVSLPSSLFSSLYYLVIDFISWSGSIRRWCRFGQPLRALRYLLHCPCEGCVCFLRRRHVQDWGDRLPFFLFHRFEWPQN